MEGSTQEVHESLRDKWQCKLLEKKIAKELRYSISFFSQRKSAFPASFPYFVATSHHSLVTQL